MIKGIQYSHYCGTELLELVSSIRLSIDLIDENREASNEWAQYALQMVSQLRDKISELDILNGMDLDVKGRLSTSTDCKATNL